LIERKYYNYNKNSAYRTLEVFKIFVNSKSIWCQEINVPDRRRRILEVVIVRRLITWVLGIWRGEGLGKAWEGEVSLQAT
jgi:hypothetical protein